MTNTVNGINSIDRDTVSSIAKQKVRRAISDIQEIEHTYLASTLLKITGFKDLDKVLWTKDVETFATDGKSLLINPDYCEALTNADFKFILLHETAHVFLGHHFIKPDYIDNSNFNIFADYVINRMLVTEGLTLPKGGLIDTDETKKAWSVLNYCEDWKSKQKVNQGGQGGDQGDEGDEGDQEETVKDFGGTGSIIQSTDEQGKPLSDEAKEKELAKINQEIAQIVIASKGVDPNSPFTLIAKEVTQTKEDWAEILHSNIKCTKYGKLTYDRPNRRQSSSNGIVLPSRKKSKKGKCLIALDTSSSVFDVNINQVFNELDNILGEGFSFTLLKFTTEIDDITEYNAYETVDRNRFQGGTDTTDVIQYANDHRFSNTVIFTDGGITHDPDVYPSGNITWILDSRNYCPIRRKIVDFGKSVSLP